MTAPLHLPLADILFISEFSAFCRTKGDEAYRFTSPGHCALAQFLKETGRATDPSVGPDDWCDGCGPDISLPAGLNDALSNESFEDCESTWTFSALADRLDALIAHAPKVVL